MDTASVVLAVGFSVPLSADRVAQLCVSAAVQLRGEPPELVRVYTTDEGVNCPPRVPEAVNPPAGKTANWPTLLTVSDTGREVFPLPVVAFAKLILSL